MSIYTYYSLNSHRLQVTENPQVQSKLSITDQLTPRMAAAVELGDPPFFNDPPPLPSQFG